MSEGRDMGLEILILFLGVGLWVQRVHILALCGLGKC